MARGRFQNHHTLPRCVLFFLLFSGSIYPYPAWGSPYQTAAHYWPMHNITNGVLKDVQGEAETVVYKGAKLVAVEQLKYALSLDGKDDWVDAGGFNGDCITDPSMCLNGFTVSFWMKVYGSGYVMSSGLFTNHRNGPGFRLFYQSEKHGFEFVLETTTKRWDLHIQADTNVWTHMAFTWREGVGLKYYEDGNLSTYTNSPKYITRSRNYTPVITLARPSMVYRIGEYGHFDISHLAVWITDLSSDDLSGVYQNSVAYDSKSSVCCYFKSVGPCTRDPCSDEEDCKVDSGRCICPIVQLKLKTCQEKITGDCEDQIDRCDLYTKQHGYCEQRKMRKKCPKACSYCARLSNETSTPNATRRPSTRPSTSTKMTSTKIKAPKITPRTRPKPKTTRRMEHEAVDKTTLISTRCPPENPECNTQILPTTKTNAPTKHRATTKREMPTGFSCEVLVCPVYARCVMKDGHAECRCRRNCPLTRKIVCGTDEETYLNKCVLESKSCNLGQVIKVKKKGPCGPQYKAAVHYWPFNHTTKVRTLLDIRGHRPGMTYNGVKMTYVDQLGYVVSLDGVDEWISLTKINGTHVEDPTLCENGLSVSFWIKYYGGEFIMSSGRYVDSNGGPGFRFLCTNCPEGGPRSKRSFLLELSTQTKKWQVSLDYLPQAWLHFAFTWGETEGLKLYTNGKLLKSSKNYERISRARTNKKEITLARPNDLAKLNGYGQFDIAHLVLWNKERSAVDMEVAFWTVLEMTPASLLCCFYRRDDRCTKNPCSAGCEDLDEKYNCICPDITTATARCERRQEVCADQIDNCVSLAKKDNCVDRKTYMENKCPQTCGFCNTTAPTVDAQAQNTQKKMSETTLILIIAAGSLGLLALLILAFYLGKYFSRKMNGEFVPAKIYQNNSEDSSNPELIPSFIDPSTPRITDVPHKPVRAQSSRTQSNATASSGGSPKKPKKPMGVKITYKPPKWD